MSAQQIKLNINDLVNRMEDEDKLQACYLVIDTIAKDDKKPPKSKAVKSGTAKKSKVITIAKNEVKSVSETVDVEEKNLPHDLSLVFLANDIFRGSEPLEEVGEIAFEKAFRKSLKTMPTLPNRL